MASTIPQAAPTVRPSHPAGRRVDPDATCVLVVEDMPSIRALLQAVLSLNGYRTVCAADGRSALKLAEREDPDLVVLDLVLPDMDGMDVLARLSRPGNGQRLPVIVVTARPREQAGAQAMAAGAVDYLEKPFDPHRLLAALRDALAAPRPAA